MFGHFYVAPLVDWLLLTPEVRNSNPAISEFLFTHCQVYWKDEDKKRPELAHLK